LINNHPANLDPLTCVTARLVDVGNGIELVDDNPAAGGQLRVIRQFGSYAAWDLGLIPSGEDEAGPSAATASAASASVAFDPPNDQNTALLFTAVQPGSAMNDVDIEFQDTLVGDVASVLFDAVGRRLVISIDASQTTANTVAAAVAAEGTFQAVLDTSSDPTNDGTGVVGAIGVVASTSGGGPDRHVSDDVNPLETKGVFNSLLRLHAALSDFNLPQIERAVEMLDDDFSRLNFCRAELGARQQGLEVMQQRIEDEDVELRSSLSLAIDADLAKVISDLSARQAAFEASLRLIGQTMQLSLLDFI
jgi:flagellin-like hook-associated protein FlgL